MSSPGDLPAILDRDAITFGARTIDAPSVALGVVLGAASHDAFELARADAAQARDARLALAHGQASHHLAVEGEPAARCRRVDGDVGAQGHHAAADVEANRPQRDRAAVGVGEDGAADGDAVAVVDVGCDHHQACPREAGRGDDLGIDAVLDVVEQGRGQEQADRDVADVLAAHVEPALAGVDAETLPGSGRDGGGGHVHQPPYRDAAPGSGRLAWTVHVQPPAADPADRRRP